MRRTYRDRDVARILTEGAFGLPVFQGGAGTSYIAGPTGSYLLGFLLTAGTVGALVDRGATRSWPRLVAVLLLGEALIYVPGLAWIAVRLGLAESVTVGLLPFWRRKWSRWGLSLPQPRTSGPAQAARSTSRLLASRKQGPATPDGSSGFSDENSIWTSKF
ncbi:MAG: biotin transporter BioY [Rhodospirillales bacterium]|nr:biotin transporter BioY [Rhodospirillales bacterium]